MSTTAKRPEIKTLANLEAAFAERIDGPHQNTATFAKLARAAR